MNSPDNVSECDDRAVRALASPWHWMLSSLLLIPASYLLLTWAWRYVLHYWSSMCAYAGRWIGVPIALVDASGDGAWLGAPEIGLRWTGRYPGDTLLLVSALVCIAAFGLSFVRKERWLPVAYVVRVIAAVQIGVCAYFAAASSSFPYTAQEHIRSMFALQTMAIKGTPVMMLLIYYPLDFTLMQKAFATLLIGIYLITILPFVTVLHASIVFYGSLLFVPLCFFVLGAPLMLGFLLTLYSYCVSWPGASTKKERL